MRSLTSVALSALVSSGLCAAASSKRGLTYVTSETNAEDDKIWKENDADLSWYYNYGSSPTAAFEGTKMQFVPMLWGAPTDTSDNSFLNDVRSQIESGAKISYVLAFNEPDGNQATGGSNVPPELAAQTWIRQLQPLKKEGVKLGLPAVTGAPGGFTWLEDFFKACDGKCKPDFIPVHWYGNFEGMASHVGQVRGTYPNITMWITEYALADATLEDSQTFAQQSSEYFDRLDYVTHYSYFGSFRSSISNVGANAAMLTQDGKLTDIGARYLNVPTQGNIPEAASSKAAVFSGWTIFVGVIVYLGVSGF
ncbi:MAG: hypothetical protein M1837_005457 [Sclerophora amabilis]|nr:MAG: hypothetical protein M1837_005457 [Sclerophora amabilis]